MYSVSHRRQLQELALRAYCWSFVSRDSRIRARRVCRSVVALSDFSRKWIWELTTDDCLVWQESLACSGLSLATRREHARHISAFFHQQPRSHSPRNEVRREHDVQPLRGVAPIGQRFSNTWRGTYVRSHVSAVLDFYEFAQRSQYVVTLHDTSPYVRVGLGDNPIGSRHGPT